VPIPPDRGPYLRLDYYRQVINALKGHILVKEILGKVAHLMAAPRATRSRQGPTDWLDMREVAEQALIRAHVKAVFADEGHRLMQGDGSQSTDEQLEWLKSLTNRTNVLHVLAGPYALFGFRNTSGQLARRGRDVHFARYHVDDKEERKKFVAALKYLLERIPLTCDLDALLSRWRWFAENCVGCIGVLKDWLVDAVKATLAQGGTSLTEDILTRTMPHPAKRLSLEREARVGEHKVAIHNRESAKQFQALLKQPTKAENVEARQARRSVLGGPLVVQTGQEAESISASLPLPQVAPKPTKLRVGQRAPERDPVGDQVRAPNALKCPFSSMLEITPQRFLDSGIFRVECPQCAAMRSVEMRNDVLRFPSHDKRKTHTPNTDQRWAMGETAWDVVGE